MSRKKLINKSLGSAVVFTLALIAMPLAAQAPRKLIARSPRITAPSGVTDMSGDPHFRPVMTNSLIRVFRVDLAAHEATLLNSHRHDYIVVSVGESAIEVSGEANQFSLSVGDGESQVLTGGWPHRLKNMSNAAAHLIVLEVARDVRPAEAICGLSAKACREVKFGRTREGEYEQSVLFETATVRLLRAELGPGGKLPPHQDGSNHVLLTLASSKLSDGISAPVDEGVGDVIWHVGPIDTVQNAGADKTRMLILELK